MASEFISEAPSRSHPSYVALSHLSAQDEQRESCSARSACDLGILATSSLTHPEVNCFSLAALFAIVAIGLRIGSSGLCSRCGASLDWSISGAVGCRRVSAMCLLDRKLLESWLKGVVAWGGIEVRTKPLLANLA